MDRAPAAPSSAGHRWDWHWAQRGALLLAPLAALAGLVAAIVLLRQPPVTALVHYVVGGIYGAVLGAALGGLLSLLKPPRERHGASSRLDRRSWVAHQHRLPASTGGGLR